MTRLRRLLLLLGGLTLAACGVAPTCRPDCGARECGDDRCGGSCGTCARSLRCGGSGYCSELDPAARFRLVVVDGQVSRRDPSGRLRDGDGLPDPQVCFDYGDAQRCTRPASRTVRPRWDEELLPAAAFFLLSGGLSTVLRDGRSSGPAQIICPWARQPVRDEELRRGSFSRSCSMRIDGSLEIAGGSFTVQASPL